jgi:hypothetical protein
MHAPVACLHAAFLLRFVLVEHMLWRAVRWVRLERFEAQRRVKQRRLGASWRKHEATQAETHHNVVYPFGCRRSLSDPKGDKMWARLKESMKLFS